MQGASLDIQKLITKLPFSTTGIRSELHYVLNGQPMSYVGPGTSLRGYDGRPARCNTDCNENNLNPVPWSKEVNQADVLAHIHDHEYEQADKLDSDSALKQKHEADKQMISALQQIDANKFSEKFMKWIVTKILQLRLKLGMGIMEDEAKVVANELHKPIRHKFQRRMIIVNHYNEIHCCDLIHLIPPEEKNKVKYNYVLTYMDLFSRYAWAYPLKNKTSEQIVECLSEIWKNNKPERVWSDHESGLYSKHAEKFFKDSGVELYSTESEIKCGPIERFNRTLKEKMEKLRSEYSLLDKPFKFLDHLHTVINKYNKTIHSSIGMTPIDARKPENKKLVMDAFMKKYSKISNESPKFKEGDAVRLYKYKFQFTKGYKPRWTDEIFFINEVHETSPPTYTLSDDKGEIIKGKFYRWELQKSSLGYVE